ncbi:hypothetical protein [Pyxidicoccus xibeiensis]|uniref:hypothetical protein n=1 Tax=Pyxidicoccus xibeiensis TaxID=2906759 RepID=UPI0020A78DF3|nr:hypothetical protein [Pyxidicoccus xibeiensis]MCP3140520.1 hypothetical protein [Pyxidicoccus xibeiensis]
MALLLDVARQELSLGSVMLEEQHKLGATDMSKEFVEVFRVLRFADVALGRPPSEEQKAELLQLRAELPRRAGLLRCFAPVARWMLVKGAAELRMPKSAPFLPTVLECLVDGDPIEQQHALRYISLNPNPEQGFWRLHRDLFWHVAEQVLTRGAPGTLVCELVAAMFRGNWMAEDCVHPLSHPEQFPHARRALLRGLLDGRFNPVSGRFAQVAWNTAFSSPPDEELTRLGVAQGETLADALEHLYAKASPPKLPPMVAELLGPFTGKPSPVELSPALEQWARFLSREWIRMVGLNAELLGYLTLGAESPVLAGAFKASIREAIAALRPTPDTELALRILDESPNTPETLRAVTALPLAEPRFTPQQKPGRHLTLLEEFRRIINLPWSEPVFGADVGRILMEDQVRDVQFTELQNEELVHIGGGWLSLHEEPFRHMAGSIEDEEEFFATATLYFLHEWFHVHQGIGQKLTVEQQRETGSELTLMHLDLSADHVAACMAQRAVPRWTLAELKGLQSQSLLSYRAGRGHTAASRNRKVTRLVSLRLDYLARIARQTPAWLHKLGNGYAFANFSPAGGAMFLLAMGPPVSVLAQALLRPEEAMLINTAMDEGTEAEDRLEQLDGLLRHRFQLG